MDVKYQVFVSSTFTDLVDERRAVIESILNIGHIPVGMEAFQASNDSQWDYIKRRIDESDYYVLIVAERYGSELNGKSYTQMEYEYAIEQGVPVAAFLLETSARAHWPSIKVEYEKKDKVEQFRKLCEKKLVKHWRNPDDLAGKVSHALNELIRHSPRVGWVRSDRVPSVKVVEELSRLSEEKRYLQAVVDELEAQSNLPAPPDVKYRIVQLADTQLLDTEYSLLEVFLLSKNMLANGCQYYHIELQIKDEWGVSMPSHFATTIAAEFATRNLVRVSNTEDGFGSKSQYLLTEYGANFIMYAERWLAERPPDVETHPL